MAGPAGRTWYAVGRLTELTETGFKGGVWKSFDNIDAATLYRDKHHLALYPGTYAARPAEGSAVEVSRQELEALQKKGQGTDLAHQVRVLEWAKEQGIFHEHGAWYDNGTEPRVGQFVHFTPGLDYRDEPEERRVFPTQPLDPGASAKRQHVVFEKVPGKPLLGRIASLVSGPEEARAEVQRLDEKRLSLEPAALQRQWREFDAGSDELRALAHQERRAPLVVEPERPSERPRVEPPRITMHEKGRHQAQVVERMGEDGKPQRTVLLSKEITEPDGRVRTAGTVLSMDDVRAIRQAMERKQHEMLERARLQEQGRDPKQAELLITSHEGKRHRAEVVERTGEDGKPQGTVLLSRETTEPDGRVRTQGTVLDLDDVREIGRAIKQHHQSVEQTRQRSPNQEHRRDQGLSMEP